MASSVPEAAQWWVSDRTERVNQSDRQAAAGATRSVRFAHLVRWGHTLCGRNADAFAWLGVADDDARRCPACSVVGPDHYIHRDLTKAAGITYRQLDVWTRDGLLRADNPDCGTGTQRTYSASELQVAQLMGRLVVAGLPPGVARRVARGEDLAPGIRVVIDEPTEDNT